MEHLIDAQHGPVALLAGLVIVLALHFLLKLGEFLWKMFLEKNRMRDQSISNLINMVAGNTTDLHRIQDRLSGLEKQSHHMSEHAKISEVNTRRIFAAIKKLSGKNWPTVRKHILEDDVT